MDVLRAALDADERSRIDADEGYTMVLVNIPTLEEQSDKELYSTIPVSILMMQDAIVTVCSEDTRRAAELRAGEGKGLPHADEIPLHPPDFVSHRHAVPPVSAQRGQKERQVLRLSSTNPPRTGSSSSC
jgi:hypothetical protein